MGRSRKHDRHLPRRLYLRRGAYFFVDPDGRWHNLGRDLAPALAAYGRMVTTTWSGRTLGEVIDRYRTEVLPLKRSPQTRINETAQLVRLQAVFGDMAPDELEVAQLYQYLDRRRGPDGSPAPTAARHEVKLLGHVLQKATRWGLATRNPVRQLERLPRTKRMRYVTDEEFAQVRELAAERMKIAMDLALLTGLRRGDLLALTWDQVKPEGVEVRTSKTGAGLLIQRTPDLEAVLDRARRLAPQLPRHFVIKTASGKRYTGSGFSAIWQRLMRKAIAGGVDSFTFHDIRRKSASDSDTVSDAQERLGHSDQATTRRFYVAKPVKVRPLR